MVTEAHKAALDCELGQLSLYDSFCDMMGCADDKPRISVNSSGCHIEKALWPVEHVPNNGWSKYVLLGMVFSIPCDESTDKTIDRLFFAAGRAHLNVTQIHQNSDSWERVLRPADNMTLWICKPKNIFGLVDAIISPHGDVLDVQERNTGNLGTPSMGPFPGITGWMMAQRVLDTMNDTYFQDRTLWLNLNDSLQDFNKTRYESSDGGGYEGFFDSFYTIYLAVTQPETSAKFIESLASQKDLQKV